MRKKAARIDWAKVDATDDNAVATQARKDGTRTPSDRAWREMVASNRVARVPPVSVDVRKIREKLGLSQTGFAARFGFTTSAVRQWEHGRRVPHGPARVLLTIIAREPGAVSRALDAVEGSGVDIDALRALTKTVPRQKEPARKFIRRMRDEERY